MKVLLLQDVAKVGRKGDVKEVAPGYAQNFLINRGLATSATAERVKAVQEQTKRQEKQNQEETQSLTEALQALKNAPLIITASANEKGHLFKAVSMKDIVEQFNKESGASLHTRAVTSEAPIKEVGEHEVLVTVGEASMHITVHVVAV